jgi:uncharacterized DUF497 family protein
MEEPANPFEWDPAKNRENHRKHGVSFETASQVFEDEWILSIKDASHENMEERFNALGEIAPGVVLFVVFTWREKDGQERIRLISARKASAHEKKAYEKARRRAEAGHRGPRRKSRNRHRLHRDA